jgi:hypothetical protein
MLTVSEPNCAKRGPSTGKLDPLLLLEEVLEATLLEAVDELAEELALEDEELLAVLEDAVEDAVELWVSLEEASLLEDEEEIPPINKDEHPIVIDSKKMMNPVNAMRRRRLLFEFSIFFSFFFIHVHGHFLNITFLYKAIDWIKRY